MRVAVVEIEGQVFRFGEESVTGRERREGGVKRGNFLIVTGIWMVHHVFLCKW